MAPRGYDRPSIRTNKKPPSFLTERVRRGLRSARYSVGATAGGPAQVPSSRARFEKRESGMSVFTFHLVRVSVVD